MKNFIVVMLIVVPVILIWTTIGPVGLNAFWRGFTGDIPGTNVSDGPSVNDIEIISYRGKWEDGHMRVLGEIKNNGSVPMGAQVEAIARDAKGNLVDSKQFWPNSVNNIQPGQSVGVGFTITEDPRAKTMELKVINVRQW